MVLLIPLVRQCYCNAKGCSIYPDQLFRKLHTLLFAFGTCCKIKELQVAWAGRVGYLSKWRKVYLILGSVGWNCVVPPVADSLLCSSSLTKWTSSGCPTKFNTFLLQTSDNINESQTQPTSSKPRIIYCQSSVMPRAKD